MTLVPGKLYRNKTESFVALWSLDWKGIIACVYPGDVVLCLEEFLFLTNAGFVANAVYSYTDTWEQVS